MTQEAFKAWWYNEGSQAPYTHHDCEEHTMRMCEIAWNAAVRAEQEPVAWLDPWTQNNVTTDYDAYGKHGIPLYITPPKRKPLTDEEWQVIADTLYCIITRKQKEIIEAALGIKE